MKEIKDLFDKPKIIGIIGDVNTGKSMLLYAIFDYLNSEKKFKLYHYGNNGIFPKGIGTSIKSTKELEKIKGSLIILDEFFSLFDLDDRKKKKQIEKTLRLIHHRNNILILCGVGENFKKFISGKINVFFFKQTTVGDLINGSKVKTVLTDYTGEELGSEILTLEPNEALMFDEHYSLLNVPYLEKYDTKLKNKPIFTDKKNKNI